MKKWKPDWLFLLWLCCESFAPKQNEIVGSVASFFFLFSCKRKTWNMNFIFKFTVGIGSEREKGPIAIASQTTRKIKFTTSKVSFVLFSRFLLVFFSSVFNLFLSTDFESDFHSLSRFFTFFFSWFNFITFYCFASFVFAYYDLCFGGFSLIKDTWRDVGWVWRGGGWQKKGLVYINIHLKILLRQEFSFCGGVCWRETKRVGR